MPAPDAAGAAGREDERGWVERARAGDQAAFHRLVDSHRDRAYGLALRIVRAPADAEEVAQDAFVRAWLALPRFRGDSSFSTWLYRIVARRAFDRAAALRGRRMREVESEAALRVAAESGCVPARAALRLRLERRIAELSDAQRAVVTLYYFEDRSVEEVARTLEIPENTVKTHLSRARAALRLGWRKES